MWQPLVYGQKKTKRKSGKLTEEEIYQADFYFIEAEKFYLIEDYSKSLSMFNRSLEINDKNAAAHYKIAQIFIEEEKYLEALPHAIKAKELDDNNKYYYILNAKLSLQLGDYNEAAKNYEEVLAKFQEQDDYLFDLAEIYEVLQEPKKAIANYDRLEYIHGKYYQITLQKQRLYMQIGEYAKAEKEWLSLIEYQASSKHYRGYMAFLESTKKNQQLKKVIQEAMEANPDDTSLVLEYADFTLKSGDVSGAVAALQKPMADLTVEVREKAELLSALVLQEGQSSNHTEDILALSRVLSATHPESYMANAMAGDVHYQMRDQEKALEYYLRAIALDDTKFEVWQNILIIETQRNAYDDVIVHVEKAKEVFPNQAVLYLYGGTAYLMKKQYANAVDELERGSRYARRNPELAQTILGQLGDAYHSIGDNQKSDSAYEKALELNGSNAYVLNNYSFYLSLRGEKLGQALKMSEKLVAAFPENPSYLDTHAWVLYKNGDFKDARKVLEKALRINDGNGTIIEHYGDVLFKLGRKEEAVVQWQKAKSVGQTSDLIDKKIADRKLYE
ncbi:MAG: tetratricopeptide repeat protein [Bacteroidota bacterium]